MIPDPRSRPPSPPGASQQPAAGNPLVHPANQAQVVEEAFAASIMASIAKGDLGSIVQAAGFKHYRDRLVEASGAPTDPIEIMMIEQLSWAHLRLGGLSAKAVAASSPEILEAYNSAAAKLMAEFRRSALALRELRSPVVPQQLVVVKQQNVGTNQQIAMVDGAGAQAASAKKADDIELASNPGLLSNVEPAHLVAPANRRQTELAETQRPDASRPAAASRSRAAKPALDQVNGAQNGHR